MQTTVIEVFKTNIQEREVAYKVSLELAKHFPNTKINFDLDDCDNILRVEGNGFSIQAVVEAAKTLGFICEPLV